MLAITSLYAALLTIVYVVLSVRTIRIRQAAKISLGAGEDTNLLRKIRVHANFAEYVPLGLILLMLCELVITPTWLLHGAGMMLLLGRLSHVYGVDRERQQIEFRVIGMALTFTALILLACNLLYQYVFLEAM